MPLGLLDQQTSPQSGTGGLRCAAFHRSSRACVRQQAPRRQSPQSSQEGSASDADSSSSASLSGWTTSERDDSDSYSGASKEEEDLSATPPRRRQGRTATSRRSRTVGQQVQGGVAPAAAAAAAVGPVEQAAAGAGQPMQHLLHQPYSNLVVCEATLVLNTLTAPHHLCTDLAQLHSEGSCPVQVSVVVHSSGWDASEDCSTYITQQQHPNAAQQQQQQAGTSQCLGPFTAIVKQRSQGQLVITGVSNNKKLVPYVQQSNPHKIVLQERVPGDGGRPHFRLHIQPGSPAKPRNQYSHHISRAGEGKGLQIFPSSVTEMMPEAAELRILQGSQSRQYLCVNILKVLACSQLPATVKFPLSVTVRVLEQQAAGQSQSLAVGVPDRSVGQWPNLEETQAMKLYLDTSANGKVYWRKNLPHPLSAYVGRLIAKMSLVRHQDSYRLTFTLAPTTAAAVSCAAPTTAAAAAAAAVGRTRALAATTSSASARPPAAAAAAAATAAPPALTPAAAAALVEAVAAADSTAAEPPPPSQTGHHAAAGGRVGGVSAAQATTAWLTTQGPEAQPTPPAAVARGVLSCHAPPGPSVPSAGPPAQLLRKQPAIGLRQQPATARQDPGNEAAAVAAAAPAAVAQGRQHTSASTLSGHAPRDPRSALLPLKFEQHPAKLQQAAHLRRDAGSTVAATAGASAAENGPSKRPPKPGRLASQQQQQQDSSAPPAAAAGGPAAPAPAALSPLAAAVAAPAAAANLAGMLGSALPLMAAGSKPAALLAAAAAVVASGTVITQEPAASNSPAAPISTQPVHVLLPLKRHAEQPLQAAAAKQQRHRLPDPVAAASKLQEAFHAELLAADGSTGGHSKQLDSKLERMVQQQQQQWLAPLPAGRSGGGDAASGGRSANPANRAPAAANLITSRQPLMPIDSAAAAAFAGNAAQWQQGAAGGVWIKQEAPPVVDLTADSEGEGGETKGTACAHGNQHRHQRQRQRQQQPAPFEGPPPAPPALPTPPAPAATPAPEVAATAAAAAAAAAAVLPAMTAPGSGTTNPGAVPPVLLPAVDASGSLGAAQPGAATASNAAAAATALLPQGLNLPTAATAAAIEKQVTLLMSEGLRPLLPPHHYNSLMGQLREGFRPYRQIGGGAAAASAAAAGSSSGGDFDQLQVMYLYLQAAVDGRQLSEVLLAVDDLIHTIQGDPA